MRKIVITSFLTVALSMAAISCGKQPQDEPSKIEGKKIEITVKGLMGEYTQADITKAQLVNYVSASWEGNETVYVFDGKKCIGTLAANPDGIDGKCAILSTDATKHTVYRPSEGTTSLCLVYSPIFEKAPVINDGVISVSLANQSGSATPFVAFATIAYDNDESIRITDSVVPFKFATSVIKINCTGLIPDTTIDKVELSNVNTECRIILTAGAEPVVEGAANGTITRTGDICFEASNVNEDGEAVFQIAIPVLSEGKRTLTVTQGDDDFVDKHIFERTLGTAASVNTICQLIPGHSEDVIRGKFTVGEGVRVFFSAGNLQATYDASTDSYTFDFASDQTEFIGNAPGNTTLDNQTDGAVVDLFGWSTGSNYYGICGSLDKSAYSGDFIDWGTAIESEDTWRTLTIEEWDYLVNTRKINDATGYGNTYVRATVNGVEGLIIFCDGYIGETAGLNAVPKGCAFLPFAGSRSETAVDIRNFRYWSASPEVTLPAHAYNFYFEFDVAGTGRSTRNFGYPVRLVSDVH